MKINFLLPNGGSKPIGGLLVAYEYANRLAKRGHLVTLIHTPSMGLKNWKRRTHYIFRALNLRGGYKPDKWFVLSPNVRLLWVPELAEFFIPDADATVATYWETAQALLRYSRKKGKKYYLIQDYEFYMTADEATQNTIACIFRSGLFNLPISPACEEMLNNLNAPTYETMPNGLDFDKFFLERSIQDSERCAIGFPFRVESFKGSIDAIRAFEVVKKKYPEILIWTFGHHKPHRFPEWIEFHKFPSFDELRRHYNRTKIFVTPSHFEGWGLPGLEAMACGAALVSTEHGGVKAYAVHKKNAMLSPPKSVDDLVKHIIFLLECDEARINLARQGVEDAKQFDWETSTSRLERVLNST